MGRYNSNFGKRELLIAKKQKFQSEKNAIHIPKFNLMTYITTANNANEQAHQEQVNLNGNAEIVDQQQVNQNSKVSL